MTADQKEGPFEGSRCLAAPAGYWKPGAIRRVNEDGTFTIEFDVKEMILLKVWYGVTLAELSFDDSVKWPSVFGRLCSADLGLSKLDLGKIFPAFGYCPNEDQLSQFWREACNKLFDIDAEQADRHLLDRDFAYKLFLHAGISAKQCEECFKPDRPELHAKVYWNQTRMGGREPSELTRSVTLADAFAALGIGKNGCDAETMNVLDNCEKSQHVKLPAALKQFLSRQGVAQAVSDAHPNNPELLVPGNEECKLRRDMKKQNLRGDYALGLLNQDDFDWYAVFEENDDDAQVYLTWRGESGEIWRPAAPSIGMFFWDLAQTGLCWYQDTKFQGGKAVRKTDIGLIPDQ
jgi:hypothetical protein